MNTATPRKLSIGRTIGLGFLAVVAILVLWNLIWRMGNNRAVARLEAAAHERGEPVTVQELAAVYPKVADAENIHHALVKVWASEDAAFWDAFMNGTRPLPQQQDEKFDEHLPYLGQSRFNYTNDLGAVELAAIHEFLATKKPHMDAVRAALRLKTYSANYDFNQAYAMLLPELSKVKHEAQFFALDALDAIAAGDNARAIAAIRDITRTGNALKTEPLLISQLVRIACHGIAISTSERLLKQRPLTEAECGELGKILDEMKQDDGIKRSMFSERACAWFVLDGPVQQVADLASSGPGEENSSPGGMAFGFRLMRFVGLAGAEKRLMGETYDQTIRCLGKPDHAATDELRDIFAAMDAKSRQFPPKVITRMLMPALAKAGEKASRLEAQRRCAVTALAVERHRLAHKGALPAQLSELGSATLDDPFTGQPLQFKKTERGYVVYSFGPDRKDNDAQLEAPKSGSADRQADIGFRVEHK